MAELNRQESIKLNKNYQFRISCISTARSSTVRQRNRVYRGFIKKQNQESNQKSLHISQKFPNLAPFKRALQKIGAIQKQDFSFFQPQQTDQKSFRDKRTSILKMKLFRNVSLAPKQQPYTDELDEAALDCWKYGQSNGSKTVWRRYRQNLDDLSYFTLKVTSKKKIH